MPVFKSYKNNKGNYIRARPSDTGNITYQTTPEAEGFIKKLGYTDDDDLPWGIINPLRAAELIYTEGQGPKSNLDDAPELDPSELATISADEAEKLLSYLQSRGDVPDEIHEQLREIIEENTMFLNIDCEKWNTIKGLVGDIHVIKVVGTDATCTIGDEDLLSGSSDTSYTQDTPNTMSPIEAWKQVEEELTWQNFESEAKHYVNANQSKEAILNDLEENGEYPPDTAAECLDTGHGRQNMN